MKILFPISAVLTLVFTMAGCNQSIQTNSGQNIPVTEKVNKKQQLNYVYSRDDEHVYFLEQGMGGDKEIVLIEADPVTFKVFASSLKNPLAYFAKDKNFIYYDGQKVESVSGEKFEFIFDSHENAIYAKDKNNVYIINHDSLGSSVRPDRGFEAFQGVDPASFVFFEDDKAQGAPDKYSKDNAHVYFGRKLIKGADAASFSYVALALAKDKNNVYFMGKKVSGADAKTIEYVPDFDEYGNTTYFKDSRFVYNCFNECEILKGVDPKTFKPKPQK